MSLSVGAANAVAYFIHDLIERFGEPCAAAHLRARANAARLHAPGVPRLTWSSLGLRVTVPLLLPGQLVPLVTKCFVEIVEVPVGVRVLGLERCTRSRLLHRCRKRCSGGGLAASAASLSITIGLRSDKGSRPDSA